MIVRLLFVFVSDFFFFLIDWSSRPLDLPNRFCQFPKKNQQKKQKQKPEMVRFSFVFFLERRHGDLISIISINNRRSFGIRDDPCRAKKKKFEFLLKTDVATAES